MAIFVTPVLVAADHPDLAQRVRNSRKILAASFPGPPLLNTPVLPEVPLPDPLVQKSQHSWDPWAGEGSQWQGTPLFPTSLDRGEVVRTGRNRDRKSTRLNSSH